MKERKKEKKTERRKKTEKEKKLRGGKEESEKETILDGYILHGHT